MEKHNRFRIDFWGRDDFDFRNIDLTSCLIIDEALKRNIRPTYLLGKYILIENNGTNQLFYKSDNLGLPAVTKKILCSKSDTKEFLSRAGIKVPVGNKFNSKDNSSIVEYVRKLGRAVIKPDCTDYGRLVYSGIGLREVEKAVNSISRLYRYLVVEKFVKGNEYRVFVTKKGFCAVCMRMPANVIGDGKMSINNLIEHKNKGRQSKKDSVRKLQWYKIKVDDIALGCLKKSGLSLDYVPAKGERVLLRYNSNICSGGDSIEVTDKIHDSVRELGKRVLDAIPGLTYAGIDLITDDISKNILRKYRIIEVNNMPGLTLHHYPYIGKPQNAAGALLDLSY